MIGVVGRRRGGRLRAVGRAQPGRPRQSRCPARPITNACTCHRLRHLRLERPADAGSRYLAVGPARACSSMRIAGLCAQPLQRARAARASRCRVIGLVALPWQGRGLNPAAARPAVQPDHVPRHEPRVPGRDPWGTFLHAAAPVSRAARDLSALLALDAGLARLGSRMGWTNPIAWLGAMLGIFASSCSPSPSCRTFGGGSQGDRRTMYAGTRHDGWRRSTGRSTKRAVR